MRCGGRLVSHPGVPIETAPGAPKPSSRLIVNLDPNPVFGLSPRRILRMKTTWPARRNLSIHAATRAALKASSPVFVIGKQKRWAPVIGTN
jgi:hypothetical protein